MREGDSVQLAESVIWLPEAGVLLLAVTVQTGSGPLPPTPPQAAVSETGAPSPLSFAAATVYLTGPATVRDVVHVLVVLLQPTHV